MKRHGRGWVDDILKGRIPIQCDRGKVLKSVVRDQGLRGFDDPGAALGNFGRQTVSFPLHLHQLCCDSLAAGDGMDSLEFYPAKKGGELIGTAVRSFTNTGYNGLIVLMVGILPDGTIKDIQVVEHKETPGLGTKMESSKFKDQFKDIDPSQVTLKVKKDGGDIDAITAATISSRAFSEATQLAVDIYKKGGNE